MDRTFLTPKIFQNFPKNTTNEKNLTPKKMEQSQLIIFAAVVNLQVNVHQAFTWFITPRPKKLTPLLDALT